MRNLFEMHLRHRSRRPWSRSSDRCLPVWVMESAMTQIGQNLQSVMPDAMKIDTDAFAKGISVQYDGG